MTDIKDLLERASDVPIPLDPAADLARGRRAAARRGRVRLTGAVVGAVLVAGAATGGYVAATSGEPGDPGEETIGYAEASDPVLSPDPAPEPTPTATPTVPAGEQGPYYDVPPAPEGWFLVGSDAFGVIFARDGVDDAQMGDFEDRLVVLFSKPGSGPGSRGQAVERNGERFYTRNGDSGYQSVWRELASGEWVSLQYPRSAGFTFDEMLTFLDQVEVLPGAVSTR